MNLKTIRKNYDAFSLRERSLLFWKAIWRKDQSEIDAIISASPKLYYRISDIVRLADNILILHLSNLLERLNYLTMFEVFSNIPDKGR